jgi:hypothetical protein
VIIIVDVREQTCDTGLTDAEVDCRCFPAPSMPAIPGQYIFVQVAEKRGYREVRPPCPLWWPELTNPSLHSF